MERRNTFVGREQELQFLEERYAENRSQFIILYGRRRIGKTETLKKFCENKPHVFYSCSQSVNEIQLRRFSEKLLAEQIPAAKYVSAFSDWEAALEAIPSLPYGESKRLVVIDEFPYLCRGNPEIPSLLQNLWDHVLKNENVMLILCGSAMSFIEKELLAEKNPLYGRATGIYKMQPMGFYDAVKFFPDFTPEDKLNAYAVLGGVPHYLAQFDQGLTLEENIIHHILKKGCVLYSETEFLLHQELRETAIYNAVITAVAMGSTKLNEISQKSLIADTAKTSVYLKNLMGMGLVSREFSVDVKAKETANSARGRYRLNDSFFRFWYAFAVPNLSSLEEGDAEGVFAYVVRPALNQFASYAFEDVCREFVSRRQRMGQISSRYAKLGRWEGKTTVRTAQSRREISETEIDLMGIRADGSCCLAGECKYKNSVFSYGEYLDFTEKLRPMYGEENIHLMLFSRSGFDDRIKEEQRRRDNLELYTLEDILH